MIEIKDGTNFHNLLLSTKPEIWFNKSKEETIEQWVGRIAYQRENVSKRVRATEECVDIALAVLSFLRRNKIKKEDLEEQLNFELDLSGSYDWRLSEIRKIEEITKLELL
jgi:Zn-finger domain-containing protein